jgi:hypothetical protein
MLPKSIISFVLIACFVALAACDGLPVSDPSALQNGQTADERNPIQNPQSTNDGSGTINSQGTVDTSSSTTSSSGQPGESAPAGKGGTTQPGFDGQPGSGTLYNEATYKFSVQYPGNFAVFIQTAEKLAALNPKPVAAFLYMDSSLKFNDPVSGPADLEIRVYNPAGITSPESWLSSSGFSGNSFTIQPFRTLNAVGVEVCSNTLVFPNCSYVFLGNGWIFQLIPASQDGETMVDTFKFTGTTESNPGTPDGSSTIYTNATYKFAVSSPVNSVLRNMAAEKIAKLTPKPVLALQFMNTKTLLSSAPDEPADLEVRVFDRAGATSLENWLAASGITSTSTTPKAFTKAKTAGLEVCPATMLGPGCSYYFYGNGWVYQLIPASINGEAALKTFTLIP